jgi:heme-degrading monooxygenase HmoA
MLAKIIIRREFVPGKENEILEGLNKLRSAAMVQSGYVSGLTLFAPDNPQKMLVISTWQNMASWNDWKNNPARQKLETVMELYQVGPTQFEEYVIGGGIAK